MANYTYIHPTDQPTGAFRLLDWLENNFQNNDYQDFRCLVAFAKINPFYKLHDSIRQWHDCGKSSEAIIGIDHKGTSIQALQYALANFGSVYILHAAYSTFHPKLYIFSGSNKASAYYGSSNFTSGGLETNFEGGVIADFSLPADQQEFDKLYQCYTSTAGAACITKLTAALLSALDAQGALLDETKKVKNPAASALAAPASASPFGKISIKPARPIPQNFMTPSAPGAGIVAKKLVIQVMPHHNGEIFLSKTAVNQNPAFFGYPFSGTTVPKKAGNATYPQRVPDPIVNIYVYDCTGALANTHAHYSLNTIYYQKKSEIRITITPSILSALHVSTVTANYPILVMEASSAPGCDYELLFFASGSAAYQNYLAACNQSLPPGGKPVARKMGWL